MVYATAEQNLGRRLGVGMVGGGRNAFIGAVHRMAMRLDDVIELKAGCLSADPENARLSGTDLGLASDRVYSDYREMAAREGAKFIADHIIEVTDYAFDDFAATGADRAANLKLLGVGA